jgi:hypothetical protein
MKDFRRRPRDVVDQYLPVVDRDTDELVGYLTDVTVDGGMLQSEDPIEEERVFHLRMDLGEPIQGSNHIEVDAESKWCRKERNAVFHNTGFAFRDVSEENQSRIAELVERYRLMTQ